MRPRHCSTPTTFRRRSVSTRMCDRRSSRTTSRRAAASTGSSRSAMSSSPATRICSGSTRTARPNRWRQTWQGLGPAIVAVTMGEQRRVRGVRGRGRPGAGTAGGSRGHRWRGGRVHDGVDRRVVVVGSPRRRPARRVAAHQRRHADGSAGGRRAVVGADGRARRRGLTGPGDQGRRGRGARTDCRQQHS